MKKLLLLILFLVACSSPPVPDSTPVPEVAVRQLLESGECVNFRLERVGGDYHFICTDGGEVPTVTPTIATSTNTPVPPTVTPTVTVTPGQIVQPYPSAPLCNDHDPFAFHGLWNEVQGCHYDHQHGMEYPQWAGDIWGNYTQYTGGKQISYPWQTVNSVTGCTEVDCKPNGYKLHAVDLRSYGCRPQFPNDNGVSAFFSESHNLANEHDALVRVHSFFAMLLICDPNDPDNPGILVNGGHFDFGPLVSPYQGVRVPLANNPIQVWITPRDPYRTIDCSGAADCGTVQGHSTWDSAVSGQAAQAGFIGHALLGMAFRQRDYFVYLEDSQRYVENPTFTYFCGGGDMSTYDPENCFNNGTTFGVYKWRVTIPVSWDGMAGFDEDGQVNGSVTYHGWTDVNGNISTCQQAALNCAPLVLENVPVGNASLNMEQLDNLPVFGSERLPEYDYCFLDGVAVPEGTRGCIWSGWVGHDN